MFTRNSNPSIDQQQAKQQLKLLGYQPNHAIYIRAFLPKEDPRYATGTGRKNDRLNFKQIEHWQKQGYGIYFVVNGGGHKDADVQLCRTVFIEHDDLELSIQLDLWRTVKLPEPTFQVQTRKSIHSYWVFEQPIPVDQWRVLQADLLAYTGADPAIKNPSRVMRLAGSWHIKPGCEPIQCSLVSQSGRNYSYEQIRSAVPVQTVQTIEAPRLPDSQTPQTNVSPPIHSVRYQNITVPVPESVPLETCLSKESRSLLNSGVNQGGRSSGGAKLVRDLIGTATYLNSIEQRFVGDPQQMISDYASRCTPPLSSKDVDAIWKGLNDNPTPSCPPEAIETCIRSWYWKNSIKPYQQRPTDDKGKSNETETVVGDNPASGDNSPPTQLDVSATVTAVTAILAKGLESWLEQAELDALFKQTIMSHSSYWQMVATVKCKFDEVLPQDQQRLDQLIDWDNTHLDFHKVLPHMAADLLHDAQILNVDPVAIWQYILPAVLSFLGKQVNLNVDSHSIPAIIWTCLVMESGTGKTRAKKLVTSAIEKWQASETQRFQKEYAEYKDKLSTPKKEAPGEKIEPPRPERKYLFKIATMQALMRRLSEQKFYNSLLLRDEIGGWFKSLDQFSGKGETEALEIFIEGWDGCDQQIDRVDHENSFIVPQPRLSLVGGIQPGIFRKIFKDSEDSQGLQARMLFACLKVRPAKRVKGYCHLSDLLPKLFKWIEEQFPKTTLKLSPSAEVLYDKIYESIGTQAELAPTPAIRVWMRKLTSQILRIAMALHTIECFYEPNRPRHEIQRDTLERAIEIGRYYRSAFQVVQEKTADSDSISSILLKIWDLGIANPTGIIARDAYRSIKAIGRRAKELGRQVGAYTVELFTQLQEMGRGKVEKDGRQFRFVVTLSEPPSDGGGDNGGGNSPISPIPPGAEGAETRAEGAETRAEGAETRAEGAIYFPLTPSASPTPLTPPASPAPLTPLASNNENEAIGETVTAVTVPPTSIEQALQVSPNEPLSQVTTESCTVEEAGGSDELTWLMTFLTDLESQPQPHERFSSEEQLIELFLEAERKSQCCQDELNQCCPDYWERTSRMLDIIIQVLADAKPTEPNLLNSSVTFFLELAQQCRNILDVERIAYKRVKANISDDAVKVAFNQLDETTRCRIKGLKRQLKKHLATLRTGLYVQALDGFYGTICAKSTDGRFLVQSERNRKTKAQEARYYFGGELKPMAATC